MLRRPVHKSPLRFATMLGVNTTVPVRKGDTSRRAAACRGHRSLGGHDQARSAQGGPTPCRLI